MARRSSRRHRRPASVPSRARYAGARRCDAVVRAAEAAARRRAGEAGRPTPIAPAAGDRSGRRSSPERRREQADGTRAAAPGSPRAEQDLPRVPPRAAEAARRVPPVQRSLAAETPPEAWSAGAAAEPAGRSGRLAPAREMQRSPQPVAGVPRPQQSAETARPEQAPQRRALVVSSPAEPAEQQAHSPGRSAAADRRRCTWRFRGRRRGPGSTPGARPACSPGSGAQAQSPGSARPWPGPRTSWYRSCSPGRPSGTTTTRSPTGTIPLD